MYEPGHYKNGLIVGYEHIGKEGEIGILQEAGNKPEVDLTNFF